MSPLLLTLLVIALLGFANLFVESKSLCDEAPGFEVILEDNFDYPAINKTIWNVVEDDGRYLYHFACGRSALCTRGNAYIEDGDLVLRTRRENAISPKHPDKKYQFTSAGVHTRDKFIIQSDASTITRVCIRAKLPMGDIIVPPDGGDPVDTGKGLFPAYWLMANNARNMKNAQDDSDGYDDKYPDRYISCNPDEGEIDIMEHLNSDDTIWGTYHFQGTKETCQFPAHHKSSSFSFTRADLREDYHEYSVERGPNHIAFYFDGEWKHTISTSNSTVAFNSTSPYFLWLNTALGGWPGEPDENTLGPFYNRIDYVKVTQKHGSSAFWSNTLAVVAISVASVLVVVLLLMLAIGRICCKSPRRPEHEEHLLN